MPSAAQAPTAALPVVSPSAVCTQAGRTMAVNSGLKTLLAGIMRDVAALQPAEAVGAMSAVAAAAVAGFQVRLVLLCTGHALVLMNFRVPLGCRLPLATRRGRRCACRSTSQQQLRGPSDWHPSRWNNVNPVQCCCRVGTRCTMHGRQGRSSRRCCGRCWRPTCPASRCCLCFIRAGSWVCSTAADSVLPASPRLRSVAGQTADDAGR